MVFRGSEKVELKEIVVNDIRKEIIAFANCNGGKLYIGVQDDGTVVGLDDPDSVALQISNMVRDAIKPDLTMFLHYETRRRWEKSSSCFYSKRNRKTVLYCKERLTTGRGLCSSGVFFCSGNRFGNSSDDKRNRWRPF